MRFSKSSFLAVLLVCFSTVVTYAQDSFEEYVALSMKCVELQKEAKYGQAKVVAEKALEIAKKSVAPITLL